MGNSLCVSRQDYLLAVGIPIFPCYMIFDTINIYDNV